MERKHYYKSTSYHIYHHPFTSFSICILFCKTFCYPLEKKIMRNILTKDTKILQIPKLERLAGEKDSNVVAEDATKEIKIDFFVEQGFKKIIFGFIIGKNRKKITTESNSVIIFRPFPKPEGVSIIKFKMEHSYNLSQNIFRKVTKLHEIGQDQKFPVSVFE